MISFLSCVERCYFQELQTESVSSEKTKMSFYKIVQKITLLAIIIAIFFVSIQRREFNETTIFIGAMHGAVIGILLGVVVAFKNTVFNFHLKRIPFLLVILLYSVLYIVTILIGRALAIMITHGHSFQLIPDNDPHFMGAVFFIFGTMLLYNLLDQISLLTGQKQLLNFAIGKYSNPQIESRMIMFLDMRDSTSIAEQIGDKKYLSLLDDFFSLMTLPLKQSGGEIYKYIGDEAIITWPNNFQDAQIPVRFFQSFKKAIANQSSQFEQSYGVAPLFRGGLHYGSMMIGELGSVKKEIALIGDSLNTTSRILQIAKRLDKELIVSELLGNQFKEDNPFIAVEFLGKNQIKGKEEELNLFSLSKKSKLHAAMEV